MRLTTTLQQPFAVQDVEATVVGFEPDTTDTRCITVLQRPDTSCGEHRCTRMPAAIYCKLEECDYEFLPPAACFEHYDSGHNASCRKCVSAAKAGVYAVRPIVRKWKYFLDKDATKYITVERKQFPLMPAAAVSLYSMQGTTADPGLVAYWLFPRRVSATIKWLIVYVMLSRPRSLAQLRSVGLSKRVLEVIEAGPPEELVANFGKLFQDKIEATAKLARQEAKKYGLLPELM